MYYEDDFYDEPSEFDEQIEEFKASLAKSVKGEFLEEMEKLKKENQRLQSIKEHFEQIKKDYEAKKNECDRAILEAEAKAKRARAEELLEQYKIILWHVRTEHLYGPKCDKCDSNRNVKITLPSGATTSDKCPCRFHGVALKYPGKSVLREIADRNGEVYAWYSECGGKDDRYYVLEYAASTCANSNLVKPGTSFEILEKKVQYGMLFPTKEECQAYCDYLNKKDGIPDGPLYALDGKRWNPEEREQ